MAQTYSWPGPTGLATTTDGRKNLAGLIVTNTSGVARSGIFPSHTNALVTSRSDLNVNIAAFAGCAVQFGGPILLANDGTVQLPSPLVSPVSGTNYYVVYVKQNESTSPGTDANNNRIFDAKVSTTSLAAARALLPTGALELATVEMPTGKTATNQSGVVITQTHQYTATQGGAVWLRNQAEEDAWSPADGSYAFRLDTQSPIVRRGGLWTQINSGLNLVAPSSVAGGTLSGAGLVSFTSIQSVSLNGVFSSLFDNYLIQIDVTGSSGSGSNLFLRMRTGGTSDTAANYFYELFYGNEGTAAAAEGSAQTSFQLTAAGGPYHAMRLELHKPAVSTVRTSGFPDDSSGDGVTFGSSRGSLWHGVPTTHDGFELRTAGGVTISGTIRVYGYYNG